MLSLRDMNRTINRLLATRSPAQALKYARDAAVAVPTKADMWNAITDELERRYPGV